MAIKDKILKILIDNPNISMSDLYTHFPSFSKSSVRSALSRGRRAGLFDRVDYGVYVTKKKKYKKVRIALRIKGTNKKKVQNKFKNVDVEMTSEGYVPSDLSYDEIIRKMDYDITDTGLFGLQKIGVYLDERYIDFDVYGIQELGLETNRYVPTWKQETIFSNTKYGRTYLEKDSYQKSLDEWS